MSQTPAKTRKGPAKKRQVEEGGRLGREVLGLCAIFCGLLVTLSLATFDSRDPWINHSLSNIPRIYNKAGAFGAYLSGSLFDIFGMGAWIAPVFFCVAGARRILGAQKWIWWRWGGFLLLTLCVCMIGAASDTGTISIFSRSAPLGNTGDVSSHGGGLVGHILYGGLAGFMGPAGALLIWFCLLLLAIQMLTGVSWLQMGRVAFRFLVTSMEEGALRFGDFRRKVHEARVARAGRKAEKAFDLVALESLPPGEESPGSGDAPVSGVAYGLPEDIGTPHEAFLEKLDRLDEEARKSKRKTASASKPLIKGPDVAANGIPPAESISLSGTMAPVFLHDDEEDAYTGGYAAAAAGESVPPRPGTRFTAPGAAIPPWVHSPARDAMSPEPESHRPHNVMALEESGEDDHIHKIWREAGHEVAPLEYLNRLTPPFANDTDTPVRNGATGIVENDDKDRAARDVPIRAKASVSPAYPRENESVGLVATPSEGRADALVRDAQPDIARNNLSDEPDSPFPPVSSHASPGLAAEGRRLSREVSLSAERDSKGLPGAETESAVPEKTDADGPGLNVPIHVAEGVKPAAGTPRGGFVDSVIKRMKRPRMVPLPSLELLQPAPKTAQTTPRSFLESKGLSLMNCLRDFNVQGELVGITPGPVVTMFEVRPAPGVRVSRIANLSDDLALALKAVAVRIQAPVPGTDTVGIEIPNEIRETVCLRELLGSQMFNQAKSLLTLALGKDIAGNPAVANLALMPHLLVAGATGAGKSVGINSIILSILYKARPHEVKLLLVDPKRVEMAIYADLPHLVHPVVTEMQIAKNALEWAVAEMENRYDLIARAGVRNIIDYNAKVAAFGDEPPEGMSDLVFMPYLVVVIDELADLMLVAAKEVETSIVRLAQLARAAGIHLILATQRPSVDVVTGLIKANFPCRISFQVTSKHDSRTILDSVGAEHLLGKGDMLFKPGGGKFQRMHGAFVSDKDVNAVVNYWKSQLKPEYSVDFAEWNAEPSTGVLGGSAGGNGGDVAGDPLYADAVAFVRQQGKASISLIQRKFRIGFNKAARYVEQMEQDGIIGPADGSKPRLVIG